MRSDTCGFQETLTERALELLALPEDGVPKLLLDLGCGSGLSGESLTKQGHTWVVCICAACLVIYVHELQQLWWTLVQ